MTTYEVKCTYFVIVTAESSEAAQVEAVRLTAVCHENAGVISDIDTEAFEIEPED